MVSWGEIVIVFLIALLLFGADKIPEFARTAGKMVGEYRRVRDSLRDEIDNAKEEFDDVKDELDSVKDELDSVKAETDSMKSNMKEKKRNGISEFNDQFNV